MNAYYFRVIDDDGKPTGYIGMAVAEDMRNLMFVIDEFVDPYHVQIKNAYLGGICFKEEIFYYENNDFDHAVRKEFEFSEEFPLIDEDGWRTPKWAKEK